MVSVGGRFGWVGRVSLSAGVVALLATACGSRTTMLDEDAFLLPGESSSGSSSGGASSPGGGAHGGSVNLPSAGTQNIPMPTAGTGNTAPAGSIQQVCQDYCKGYAIKCPQELQPGQECLSTCVGEIGNTQGNCQTTGLSALRCLTPYFANPKLVCQEAINSGLTKCGKQVTAFKKCSGEDEPTQPTPQPTCMSSIGDLSPISCKMQFFCGDGTYNVGCSSQNSGASFECACGTPSGSYIPTSLGGGAPNPCLVAAHNCSIPGQ
jgi:hypothetical protein